MLQIPRRGIWKLNTIPAHHHLFLHLGNRWHLCLILSFACSLPGLIFITETLDKENCFVLINVFFWPGSLKMQMQELLSEVLFKTDTPRYLKQTRKELISEDGDLLQQTV